MIKFLAYGTLKTDGYNNKWYDLTLIKKIPRVNGFKMFDMGAYPAVIKNKNSYFEEGEILETTPLCWKKICDMEFYANYELSTVNIEEEEINIFTYKKNLDGIKEHIIKY